MLVNGQKLPHSQPYRSPIVTPVVPLVGPTTAVVFLMIGCGASQYIMPTGGQTIHRADSAVVVVNSYESAWPCHEVDEAFNTGLFRLQRFADNASDAVYHSRLQQDS